MKRNPTKYSLERLNKRIAAIHKKIEKEKKNVIDSGFDEDSEMFFDIFYGGIVKEYMRDMLPFVVMRHRLEPYTGKEKEKYEQWMYMIFDVYLDDPPPEWFCEPKNNSAPFWARDPKKGE
jgi:hypothetical protein